MKLALLGLPAAILLSTGSCPDSRPKLDVTFYTQIAADGGCTRRTEYRLRRTSDRNKDAPGFDQAPRTDPLRMAFRFPTGDRWTITDKAAADAHDVSLDAFLASANDLGWDYWRQDKPQAPAARNHVSFGMAGSEYEYAEWIADPNGPVEAMQKYVELMERLVDKLASSTASRLADRHLSAADVRKAYTDECLTPIRRQISLADRPLYGPAEKENLAQIAKILETCDKGVVSALLALSPGDEEPIREALKRINDDPTTQTEAEQIGSALYAAFDAEPFDDDGVDIRFHATVVMPAPIVRANTCYQGDTARWDFTQADLYRRGFEMRVVARTPR
jgi:hypothetical protein